jgi:transposase
LVPVKADARVQTDRRDSERLARGHRAGDLTAVWVSDAAHEALRDLVRAREAAKAGQLRARHRLSMFLLRHGRRAPDGVNSWTGKYLEWTKSRVHLEQPAQTATFTAYLHEVEHAAARIERLEQAIDTAVKTVPPKMRAVTEALQSLRDGAQVFAGTIVAEVGQISSFAHPRQLMGCSGAISRVYSSGERIRRGAISKPGNRPFRRIVVEAAWNCRHRPTIGKVLAARQHGQTEAAKEIAWKAQHRLYRRNGKLMAAGTTKQQAVTAIGPELPSFIWAIGMQVEQSPRPRAQVAA